MLMGSHRGGINEKEAGLGEAVFLEKLPQPLPDTALLPSAEADVDMVPMTGSGD